MPVFNSAAFLRHSLDSVLSQDYNNLEIVVIDDGSTDESPRILSEYRDRIRILTQTNRGSAAARNRGLESTVGKYIAFIDSDDVWHPDKIRIQAAHLERNPGVGLVYSDWLVSHEVDDRRISAFKAERIVETNVGLAKEESGWLYHKLLLCSLVHTSAAMVRRSVVEEVGFFDASLRKGQDYDYWLRLSRVTPFHKLDAVLSVYRLHEGGITRRPLEVNYGALIVKRAIETWGLKGPDGQKASRLMIRKRLGRIWATFGILHLNYGDLRIAKQSLSRSILYAPWTPRYWKAFFESWCKR